MDFLGDENAIFCREMVWGLMGIRGGRGCRGSKGGMIRGNNANRGNNGCSAERWIRDICAPHIIRLSLQPFFLICINIMVAFLIFSET